MPPNEHPAAQAQLRRVRAKVSMASLKAMYADPGDDPGIQEDYRRVRLLIEAVETAYRREVPDTDRWFCQVCRKIGGHAATCPGRWFS